MNTGTDMELSIWLCGICGQCGTGDNSHECLKEKPIKHQEKPKISLGMKIRNSAFEEAIKIVESAKNQLIIDVMNSKELPGVTSYFNSAIISLRAKMK